MSPAAAPAQQMVRLQGTLVPQQAIQPGAFFARTRRLRNLEKSIASFQGLGGTDMVEIRKSGLLGAVTVKFSGTLTVTPGTGTVASLAAWPYGLLRAARFSANGESNLINAGGWLLKARDIMGRGDLTDRGVVQSSGGASPGTSRQQGTLSLNSESWGVGQNVSAIPAGSYPVELVWTLPVADNLNDLLGAIMAQTSGTSLEVLCDWETQNNLFALTGNATVALAGSVAIESTKFRIPGDGQGGILLPNLAGYHGFVQSGSQAVGTGPNEFTLAGQGVGRQLMRVMYQVLNGTPPAPLPQAAANFLQPYWRYGENDTPETFTDGLDLRMQNERLFDCDLGGLQGIGVHDFASQFAFRDSVDEGAATELRIGFQIPNAVALASPRVVYAQETIFASSVGA